jgi:hypothetical protein
MEQKREEFIDCDLNRMRRSENANMLKQAAIILALGITLVMPFALRPAQESREKFG